MTNADLIQVAERALAKAKVLYDQALRDSGAYPMWPDKEYECWAEFEALYHCIQDLRA